MTSGTLSGIELRPLAIGDLDEVHVIVSDPDAWEHFPSGRLTDSESTRLTIEMSETSWAEHGFGLWSIRLDEGAGTRVIGTCGAFVSQLPVWNLSYRLAPAVWGRGIAGAVAAEAVAAAQRADATMPVVARVLATNPASSRVAAKAGLTLRWRGQSVEGAKRLIHADRPLDRDLLTDLVAL